MMTKSFFLCCLIVLGSSSLSCDSKLIDGDFQLLLGVLHRVGADIFDELPDMFRIPIMPPVLIPIVPPPKGWVRPLGIAEIPKMLPPMNWLMPEPPFLEDDEDFGDFFSEESWNY